MVDDHTQRPYRANETSARNTPAKASGSGSDPLAELARLIGQNDPFGEFGRDGARRAVAPPTQEPPAAWADEPVAPAAQAPRMPAPHPGAGDYYGAAAAPAVSMQNFGRPNFGSAPLASDADMYRVEGEVPGYQATTAPGYQDDHYNQPNQNAPQLGPEQDDYYEDEQPSRRRMGILVIAGVFALAVVGTAGAFGYRALFGSSSTSGPPPVIKAESTPSKIVPASAKDPQSGKLITDRVNDKGLGEKLVSREEQPVAVMPQDPPTSSSGPPSLGSGVVGSEPKRIRTIAIRPDQGSSASPDAPQPPPPQAQSAARSATVNPANRPTAIPPAQPPRAASNSSDSDVEAASRPAAARAPAQASAPASNAPLSLSPDARPARAAAPAPAARTASVASAPAASGGGSYHVQVSSQRSEAEAQTAFASMQGKYPGQLGGKQAVIRKVELGEKGTYYRAMVPAGDAAEANQLCSGIKAGGGSCLVQKN